MKYYKATAQIFMDFCIGVRLKFTGGYSADRGAFLWRPDKKDTEELRRFAKKIYSKLMDDELSASVFEIPGNRPYRKAEGAGLVPKATNECVSCGLCAENCPTQAISRESLKTADPKKCISCMRCVAECPRSARKVNGALVSAAALAIKKA